MTGSGTAPHLRAGEVVPTHRGWREEQRKGSAEARRALCSGVHPPALGPGTEEQLRVP